jgi:hypothetical protein
MGINAGKMLLQRIFKKRKRFNTKVIPAELIERESSKPPGGDSGNRKEVKPGKAYRS